MTGRDADLRLAIVNRGESALRCIRAVKSLRAAEGSSLRCVALYTDPDRDAPFVAAFLRFFDRCFEKLVHPCTVMLVRVSAM